jgi:hypothetical protein
MAKELGLVEQYIKQVEAERKGESLRGNRVTLKEALSSPDLSVFLHRTIIDVMKDAAEPLYVVSNFFKPVRLTEGRSIVFPAMSDIVAREVGEGMNYPQETPEVEIFEGGAEVSVKKIGLIVRVTDEMISDSQWDVVGVMLQKAGRAMARYKEEWCFREFMRHGHIIFDPDYAGEDADKFKTHGLGSDRMTRNNTLSVEDFIDLMIGNLANGFQTTDILMHPLVWPIFAKNPLLDKMTVAAFGGPGNQVTITPDQVQGKLPMAVNITLTPFCPLSLVDKKFDMFVVDRNEVGVMVVKEEMTTEQWDNPERDIRALKVKERYAPGILNNGRAITVAKNIAYAQTYPEPEIVKTITDD